MKDLVALFPMTKMYSFDVCSIKTSISVHARNLQILATKMFKDIKGIALELFANILIWMLSAGRQSGF